MKTRDQTKNQIDFMTGLKDLQSTTYSQTLIPGMGGNNTYQVDPIYKCNNMASQLLEVRGKTLANQEYQYHTSAYKDLLTKVVPLRTEFRKLKDLSARKEMAKSEFDAWNQYLEIRKYDITQLKSIKANLDSDIDFSEAHAETSLHYDHEIPEPQLYKLREFFDRSKVSLMKSLYFCLGP